MNCLALATLFQHLQSKSLVTASYEKNKTENILEPETAIEIPLDTFLGTSTEHSLSNMSLEETSRSHHQKINKLSSKCSTTAFTSKELNETVTTDSITDHHNNTISHNADEEIGKLQK